MKNTEIILLEQFLFNKFNVIKENILGIYIWGSKLYGTFNDNSDLDYIIILDKNYFLNNNINDYKFEYQSETLDIHFLSEETFKEGFLNCDIKCLECYFQEEPILKYKCKFDLNLINLRHNISSVSSNSFVKFKKKLTVEEGEKNIYIGLKSLYHSIRILDLGRDIADSYNQYKNNERSNFQIRNLNDHGVSFNYIMNVFNESNNDFEKINKIFKPIYNEYYKNFKLSAPIK